MEWVKISVSSYLPKWILLVLNQNAAAAIEYCVQGWVKN